MSITNNIQRLQSEIPESVKLIAVSKTKPNEMVLEAYEKGQRVFGENRPQELKQKHLDLPKDIEWHFIGHPQSKQVKYFASFVSLIHGVDSVKLLQVIDKEGAKNSRTINCLLQFHIAKESTKFGLNIEESIELLNNDAFKALQHVRICGVMGMATHTEDMVQIDEEFSSLNQIFQTLKSNFFPQTEYFKEISMGMSADYQKAIEHGSTMVRVGSSIFGVRDYS